MVATSAELSALFLEVLYWQALNSAELSAIRKRCSYPE